MTYKQFENLINTYEKIYNDFSELYSIGFNLLEGKYAIEEPVGKLVDIALKVILVKRVFPGLNGICLKMTLVKKTGVN